MTSQYYSNASSSGYAHLGDPYQMLDLTASNACRLYPYVSCKTCATKDPRCTKMLQGISAKFEYTSPGKDCLSGALGAPCDVERSKQVCGSTQGGLRCKYY